MAIEPHGTIIGGRWKGTRGAQIGKPSAGLVTVRPFNDTAKTEDARIHLSPLQHIAVRVEDWRLDELPRD